MSGGSGSRSFNLKIVDVQPASVDLFVLVRCLFYNSHRRPGRLELMVPCNSIVSQLCYNLIMLDSQKRLRITLESHGEKHTFESWQDDYTAKELIEAFKHLMVAATYPPSILSDEEGAWEWHEKQSEGEDEGQD